MTDPTDHIQPESVKNSVSITHLFVFICKQFLKCSAVMKEMWYSSNRFEKSLCCHKLADFIDATLLYPEAETGISSSMEILVCLSWQWHQSALWWARILRPCLDWVGVNTALASNVFMCTLEHRGDSWDVLLCSLYHDQCEMNRVRGGGWCAIEKTRKEMDTR